ncbi:dynein axonemal assembly factor 6 [Anabrus simplex]|uniref:dynein axonemal assembly factor 6 n=1 Tax=Anabrus simplex TaxID=316456 RepID=UPI0034DD0BD5
MEFSISDIRRLADILKPPETPDSDDDLPETSSARLGPADIVPVGKGSKAGSNSIPEDTGAIWDEKEVPEDAVCEESADPRTRPQYDIKFRQAVTTEDIYLQMGNRTPATASCEDMVVTIPLPGERYENVNLNVERSRIDVRSPVYRLVLPLPHTVDPNSSRAQWDHDKEELKVILRVVREFDYINF